MKARLLASVSALALIVAGCGPARNNDEVDNRGEYITTTTNGSTDDYNMTNEQSLSDHANMANDM